MNDAPPLRLGIAGPAVAATMLLPGIEQFALAAIAAAANIRQSARDAFVAMYGGRVYSSADAIINVIWIVTPNHLHREHTVMATRNGKHIICTKPMALTVVECTKMCEAADNAGVKLVCGQTYSMSPDIPKLAAIARSGELGRLIAINNWMYTDWLLRLRVAEELHEAMGGGMVRSVRAQVECWMAERLAPGNFSAFIEFEDGTPATIA